MKLRKLVLMLAAHDYYYHFARLIIARSSIYQLQELQLGSGGRKRRYLALISPEAE